MKVFTTLFAIAVAVTLVGMAALYGASLRKTLMGNYEEIMATARRAAVDFNPIDD